MKNLQDQVEVLITQPQIRCDFSHSRCYGRLQLPVGSQLYLDKEHAEKISPVMVVDSKSYIYHVDFSFSSLSDVARIENQDYYDNAVACISTLISNELVMSVHEIGIGGLVTALLKMNFPNVSGGMKINLKDMGRNKVENILFATNPGMILQISEKKRPLFEKILNDNEIYFARIGYPCDSRRIAIRKDEYVEDFDIDYLRKLWYPDFKETPLMFSLGYSFTGKLENISPTLPAAVQGENKILCDILKKTGFNIIQTDSFDDIKFLVYNFYTPQIDKFLMRGDTLALKIDKNDDINPIRFVGINIEENNNILLASLSYRKLGIWSQHDKIEILDSHEGRHLTINALLDKSIYPDQWGWYPENKNHDITPWVELFINARNWLTHNDIK